MIQFGIVQNIAAWDGVSHWVPDSHFTLVDITSKPSVGIGWSYDGVNFTAPPQET